MGDGIVQMKENNGQEGKIVYSLVRVEAQDSAK